MKKKILLIIPAYNEQDNILKTYNTVINYNKKNKENYDVIVINDGSTDQTGKICDDNNIPVSRKLLKNARQTFMEFLFQ